MARPSSDRIAVAFLLKQAVPRALSEALRDLDRLDELSQSIEEVTDAFSTHYRMGAAIPTGVKSQHDALKKASDGLKKAREIETRVAGLLEIYPEDKTAQRAAKDAATMVKRFVRLHNAAFKMIRTLSKKAMPDELKKMAASVQRGIKRKLNDPKALEVTPWVTERRWYGVEGAIFQVIFRIEDESIGQWNNKAEMTLQLNTLETKGVQLTGESTLPEATSVKAAIDYFLARLQGYAGLVGEKDRTSGRMKAAEGIAAALRSWGRRVGDDGQLDIGKGGLSVSYGVRLETRWEQYSEGDREDGTYRESSEMLKSLRPYLREWKAQIKDASVGYAEKGWWDVWVELK